MLPNELIVALSPVVVYIAVQVVKMVAGRLPGAVIVAIIVPLLSLLVAFVTDLIVSPDISFWAQAGYGLLAVFVNEIIRQLQQAAGTLSGSIMSLLR
jgi:hypothetical protein